jgi:hypothetical protein
VTCNVNQYFHSNKLNFCKINFFNLFIIIISLSLIACSKHIAPKFCWMTSPLQNHILCEHKESTFRNGQVLQTRKIYFDKRTKAPHRAVCILGCGLLFGLGSFLFFSFLVPLLGVFIYLFIYLFIDDIFPYTPRKGTTLLHTRCSLGMAHCHVWPTFGIIICPYYLLLAFAMPMPLWALPTVIMVSKHVITRRWEIGRYFITYYARHPTFPQKGISSCPYHLSSSLL